MALADLFDWGASPLTIGISILVVLSTLLYYVTSRPALPKDAPKLTSISWPVIGSRQFFTKRWEFYQAAKASSKTGNFSFYAGEHTVVALSGQDARKMMFESSNRDLGFSEAMGRC